MSKSNIAISRFRCRNRFSAEAGALIRIQSDDLPLQSQGVWIWLQSLPSIFRITEQELQGSLFDVLVPLLMALTEQARLDLDALARVIQRSDDAVVFWLPLDEPRAADVAVELALHGLSGESSNPPDPKRSLQLWLKLKSLSWNQTHRYLALAAQRLDVPVMPVHLGGTSALQLGQGACRRLLRETLTDRTSLFSSQCGDKAVLHQLLATRGIPLPVQRLVKTADEAIAAAVELGWPVVLKPSKAGKGRGVWIGLRDSDELLRAWQNNIDSGFGAPHLIQQVVNGHDHRMLVVNGVLLATAQRRPAELCADGIHCLSYQIRIFNQDPERGKGYERLFNQVKLDARLEGLLATQGLSFSSIPAEGTMVLLSRAANLSQGGYSIDCSKTVHSDNRRLAEDVACLLGTDVVGLDVMSDDLSVSWRDGGTWLLEANLSPGLRPHLAANPGTDLCERFIRSLCGPDLLKTKIPIALVTGSVGKTTTTRVLAHLLRSTHDRVALSSSTGMELDGQVIREGDLSGAGPARRLLTDKRVEALVVEIARGGLFKFGLGLDSADGAIITCVDDNHVGFDGIKTREQMARVKGMVAQVASRIVVLNADDPLVLAMAHGRAPQTVALVGCDPGAAALQQHRQVGGLVALFDASPDGWIRLFQGDVLLMQICLSEIPASQGGAVMALAPASAFALALAVGLGQDPQLLVTQLRSFGLESIHSAGRFEHLVQKPLELLLTWADGEKAMRSVTHYAMVRARQMTFRRKMLLLSAPNKRDDSYIRAVGAATAGFDQVFCAEWGDPEPSIRATDEVPSLLMQGISAIGSEAPKARVVGSELEAVEEFVGALQPGDLAIVTSFFTKEMRQRLNKACHLLGIFGSTNVEIH